MIRGIKMSDTKNSLETWVVEQLLPIDSRARRSPGSGCGNSVGDVNNKYLWVECKQCHVKENIIIKFKEVWQHLLFRVPESSEKIPVIVSENMYGNKFVTLDAEDFFDILKEAKG
jgi:hypothetical protein